MCSNILTDKADIIESLEALSHFGVDFNFYTSNDHENVFRSLISTSPWLLYLEVKPHEKNPAAARLDDVNLIASFSFVCFQLVELFTFHCKADFTDVSKSERKDLVSSRGFRAAVTPAAFQHPP